jgi:predicted deacylase
VPGADTPRCSHRAQAGLLAAQAAGSTHSTATVIGLGRGQLAVKVNGRRLFAIVVCAAFVAPLLPAASTASEPPSADTPLAPPGPQLPRPPIFDSHVYHHYPDMTTELQNLAQQNPDIAKLSSIGKSVQGRELWQMEVTDFAVDDGGKLTVYIDGGHHGNEQLGMEMALLLVHEAIEGRLSSPEMLARYHFFIVPMVNPDGNMMDQRTNANGVDLNRNYGFEWTDESNHGSGPESEPESHANAQNMRKVDNESGIDLYLSGHTGTNILIYSWAWSMDPAPDDEMLYHIGSAANNETGVAFGQTSHELYIATGSSKDLAYGELGAAGFTYEVDDQQNRFGTYTTTIAERLSVEVDTCLFVISKTEFLRADLRPVAWETKETGAGPTVAVTIENRGWASAVNATATLAPTRGGATVREATKTFSISPENRTTVEFPVEAGGGPVNLTLTLDYMELKVANGTANQSMFQATVNVKGSGLAALAQGGIGLGLVGAVAAVALVVLYDRRSGGRVRRALRAPGSALRTRTAALRGMLPKSARSKAR